MRVFDVMNRKILACVLKYLGVEYGFAYLFEKIRFHAFRREQGYGWSGGRIVSGKCFRLERYRNRNCGTIEASRIDSVRRIFRRSSIKGHAKLMVSGIEVSEADFFIDGFSLLDLTEFQTGRSILIHILRFIRRHDCQSNDVQLEGATQVFDSLLAWTASIS